MPPRHALLLLLVLAVLPTGCRTLGYYAHVGHGQLALMAKREPIDRLIEAADTDPGLRGQLIEVRDARAFASEQLGLPRNHSYTHYVALPGPHVTVNVFAAPEFSVEPVTHCFPIAGCVAYRGYFDPDKAQREAERLRARGYETYLNGAAAYSTLGWFADPVLSSMLGPDPDDTIGTIFHELAHQWLYLRDDTAFNESLATFVERQGLVEWRRSRGEPPPDPERDAYIRAFTERSLELRETLDGIYRSPITRKAMRARRKTAISAFRQWHARARRTRWPDDTRLDRWATGPITNAKLAPLALYDGWVPAFEALFRQVDGNWAAFQARVEALAARSKEERDGTLERLQHEAVRT